MGNKQSKRKETQDTKPRWRRRLVFFLLLVATVFCALGLSYFWYRNERVAHLQAECQAAYRAEQWEQLERSALEWFQWQPENPLPLIYAAQAATEHSAITRSALYLYQLPDKNDPQTIAGLLELSHLQFGRLKQPIAGAETCKRILRIQPENQEAHRRLVFYYVMTRQRSNIIEEARRAIQQGSAAPATFLYLIGADWLAFTNGREVNAEWLQSSPGNELFIVAAAFHYVRSAALDESTIERDEGGVNRLERAMLELLEYFPRNPEVLAYHLDLACFRGNVDRVIKLLKQAPPDSSGDSRFWRFKGWVHEQRRELAEAEEAYLQAVELNPYDGQTYHWLAALYRQKKELKKADKFQKMSVLGREIMRQALRIPNTMSIPPDLLEKMQQFADMTGDKHVAHRLRTVVASL